MYNVSVLRLVLVIVWDHLLYLHNIYIYIYIYILYLWDYVIESHTPNLYAKKI